MGDIAHTTLSRMARLIHLTTCLSVVLMLLTLPIPRDHQLAERVRAPEITRLITRSVSPERCTNDTCDSIGAVSLNSFPLMAIAPNDRLEPVVKFAITPTPRTSLTRLLLRLKLGSPRSGASDPLV